MANRTLIYFAIRGRAEPIRLMFEDIGLEYEDNFVMPETWQTMKPSTPFGGLPLYEEDGCVIAHSQAIIRHIARKHDCYGNTERERILCDVTEETFVEAEDAFWRPLWNPETDKSMAVFAAGPLKQTLANMDAQFGRADGLFWAGGAITFSDYLAFRYLDEVAALYSSTLVAFPKLDEFRVRMSERPRIAGYFNSCRSSPALGIGFGGPVFDPRISRATTHALST